MSNIKFKVWWIPQVGSGAGTFDVPVSSREEGLKITEVLAKYDLFQYERNIKPDYCNAGGVVFQVEGLTEGEDGDEWWDVSDDDDEWKDTLEEIERFERRRW